jgi:hypothetical protein
MPAKGPPMYSVVPYFYADASNYKQYSEIALRRELSDVERNTISRH